MPLCIYIYPINQVFHATAQNFYSVLLGSLAADLVAIKSIDGHIDDELHSYAKHCLPFYLR